MFQTVNDVGMILGLAVEALKMLEGH